MKFSSVLSIFLAGLSIASPLEDKISDEYKKVQAAHSDLKNGQNYAFSVTWPLGDGTNFDSETPQEIQDLQKELGFKHIGVIVGKVTDETKGKGKNKHQEKSFTGQLFHLIKKKDGSADLDVKNYKVSENLFKNGQLKYLKDVSSKSASDAKKNAKKYFEDDDHKKYSVADNNCNSFAEAFEKNL
ncbi:hypothetical protein G7054_g8295 [Neopestalotiopsis clavispora]|nr:hypothetical protein G7054_g8295 [Neopestalotiopsis clavispora]